MFQVGGHAKVDQEGEWALTTGDVWIVPAGHPHRLLEATRVEQWGLGFCGPCLGAEGAPLLTPFERVREGAAAVIPIPPARQSFLETLFRELADVGSQPGSPLGVQQSLLTLVLNEVERAAAPTHANSEAHRPSVVTQSLRYIERHALRKLTLQEVAEAVGRSPAYVTSALTQATGRSAVTWITTVRMAEARRLLASTDAPVEELCERLGYACPTHFIRMFRRVHGATPAAWRRTHAVTQH